MIRFALFAALLIYSSPKVFSQSGHDYSEVCNIIGAVFDYRQKIDGGAYNCVIDPSSDVEYCLRRQSNDFSVYKPDVRLTVPSDNSFKVKHTQPVVRLDKQDIESIRSNRLNSAHSRLILKNSEIKWLPRSSNPAIGALENQLYRLEKRYGSDDPKVAELSEKISAEKAQWSAALQETDAYHSSVVSKNDKDLLNIYNNILTREKVILSDYSDTNLSLESQNWLTPNHEISCGGSITHPGLYTRSETDEKQSRYVNTLTGKTKTLFGYGRLPKSFHVSSIKISKDQKIAIAIDSSVDWNSSLGQPSTALLLRNTQNGWKVIGVIADNPIFIE